LHLNARHPPLTIALGTWALGALLYLAGYFQRNAPAVLTNELSTEFALGAAGLGNLAAIYFYAYAAMQIPTGVLLDHYGPRRVLAIGSAVAACGTFVFAFSSSYAFVSAGRFAIGASVGVAFVGMLKLASRWIHPSKFAAVTGLALTMGVIGGVVAGVPLRLGTDLFGWRNVMIGAGVTTTALAIAIWLLVRDDPSERGFKSFASIPVATRPRHGMLGGFFEALRYRNVWITFLGCGAISGPPLAFSGLWGVPFLVQQYGMSEQSAALVTSILLIAWAIAGPVAGLISDRLRRRKALIAGGGLIATIFWASLIWVPGLPYWLLIAVIVGTGVASSVVMLGFAFAKESAPIELVGTVSGIANMGNMLAGTIMQPLIGIMLDALWRGAVADGIRLYDLAAWQTGFSIMIAWILGGSLLMLLARETYCRQTV
jgi:sugar phosphate permease